MRFQLRLHWIYRSSWQVLTSWKYWFLSIHEPEMYLFAYSLTFYQNVVIVFALILYIFCYIYTYFFWGGANRNDIVFLILVSTYSLLTHKKVIDFLTCILQPCYNYLVSGEFLYACLFSVLLTLLDFLHGQLLYQWTKIILFQTSQSMYFLLDFLVLLH